MKKYRTGMRWGRTIVQIGEQPRDGSGHRQDDTLVGIMDTPELAELVVSLLNQFEKEYQ